MKDDAPTREEFIAAHLLTCKAGRVRKYGKGARGRYHTLEYSRRKCAVGIWRKMTKREAE